MNNKKLIIGIIAVIVLLGLIIEIYIIDKIFLTKISKI